jgi:hypothetical protein
MTSFFYDALATLIVFLLTAYSSCSLRKDLPASNEWMAYSSSRSLSESRRDAH